MTATPSPAPYVPKREPALGAGVNDDRMEARSRIADMILRNGIKDESFVMNLMDRIELGPDFDQEDS